MWPRPTAAWPDPFWKRGLGFLELIWTQEDAPSTSGNEPKPERSGEQREIHDVEPPSSAGCPPHHDSAVTNLNLARLPKGDVRDGECSEQESSESSTSGPHLGLSRCREGQPSHQSSDREHGRWDDQDAPERGIGPLAGNPQIGGVHDPATTRTGDVPEETFGQGAARYPPLSTAIQDPESQASQLRSHATLRGRPAIPVFRETPSSRLARVRAEQGAPFASTALGGRRSTRSGISQPGDDGPHRAGITPGGANPAGRWSERGGSTGI